MEALAKDGSVNIMKKVIVFGSFDPLHKGHVDFFKQAKKLGDFLTIVVARDSNIRELKKHEPMLDEEKRLKQVRKAGLADRVILGGAGDYKVLESEKPDIIALGYDQVVPDPLKNRINKYKIVTLKPYKSEIYKSSLIKQ